MRLVLKNICKVRYADIKLNGLTVIAGENSSGKSTVGKVLFSTIKALADTRTTDLRIHRENIDKQVDSLYKRLRGVPDRFENKELDNLFPLPKQRFVAHLLQAKENGNIEAFHQTLQKALDSLEITPRVKTLMLRDLDNLMITINNKDNKAAAVKTAMEYSIESEFMNSICSYGHEQAVIEYGFSDAKESRLTVDIENEQVKRVYRGKADFLIDATYVESPLYIHMLDTLMMASTFREQEDFYRRSPMLPIHIKDLAEKIDSLKLAPPVKDKNTPLAIQEIIDGNFLFDKKKRALVFKQRGNIISPINVASGIKSFGLVQMLLETNTISPEKVLIWDEPENHLHPQWQVAFADLMVQLSKMGIPVLVSTHSPYFVQGVRFFAAKHGVESYVDYYLAEIKEDGLSDIKEVTDDLNAIFYKLAQPLSNIMNVDLERKQKK